jgi:DNA helicase HerA-like ATPase
LDGGVAKDLDSVVASWVGHDRPITVLDISGLPANTMAAVSGTVLRIVYDALFWATNLPTSGRNQPLLIVLEEAHRILPAGVDSPAMRATTQIAKEGRKYGVGLLVVTQRPTEIEPSVLSQCGTMISLRLSNGADRAIVSGTMPDDLGNLASMLPALRTGEGLAVGEALPIPTRLRFRLASSKPQGDDPNIAKAWKAAARPDPRHYATAILNWRKQSE